MMANQHQRDQKVDLREAFRVFDRDGNGFITKSELSQALSALGEDVPEDEVENMIKHADLDGDGQVNFLDFTKMMKGQH